MLDDIDQYINELGHYMELTVGFMIVGGFALTFIYAIIRGILFNTGWPAGGLIRKLARRHRDVLSEKWLRCLQQDEYGQPDRSQWLREMNYFLQSTALPVMTELQREWVSNTEGAERCYEIITMVAAKHARTMQSIAPKMRDGNRRDASPTGLEHYHYRKRDGRPSR